MLLANANLVRPWPCVHLSKKQFRGPFHLPLKKRNPTIMKVKQPNEGILCVMKTMPKVSQIRTTDTGLTEKEQIRPMDLGSFLTWKVLNSKYMVFHIHVLVNEY